jgi:hypothetical protein
VMQIIDNYYLFYWREKEREEAKRGEKGGE